MAFQEAGLQLMEKLSAVHPAHLLTTCHVCLIFVRIYEGPGKCRITNTVSVVPHEASTSKVLQLQLAAKLKGEENITLWVISFSSFRGTLGTREYMLKQAKESPIEFKQPSQAWVCCHLQTSLGCLDWPVLNKDGIRFQTFFVGVS